MIVLAVMSLAVALTASGWTTAYAWTAALPNLLWLDRVRRDDATRELAESLHATLDTLIILDNQERLAYLARV